MSQRRTLKFDWSRSESPSSAVIYAVAEFRGLDPIDIDPLYTAVDPDALDTLSSSTRRPNSTDVSVEFMYCGLHVRVDATGEGQLVEEA